MVKVLFLLPLAIAAHQQFDEFCCTGKDCKPAPCGEIRLQPDGSYTYRALNGKPVLRRSFDETCYVCIGNLQPFQFFSRPRPQAQPFLRCIYLPIPRTS